MLAAGRVPAGGPRERLLRSRLQRFFPLSAVRMGLVLAVALVPAFGCSRSTGAVRPGSVGSMTSESRPWQTVDTAAYRLHHPTLGDPVPLVLVLGASGQTLNRIATLQGQNDLAERDGFAVVYVPAPNAENIWYTGPNSSNVRPYDGVKYLTGIVDQIATRTRIDRSRVYIEGWSNGGFMAVHAATTAPDVFAAAGELESVLDMPVRTTSPVRIIHIHSPFDEVVPINGGNSPLFHGAFGRSVQLPSSFSEGRRLPIGSTWSLVTDVGSGPAHHGYQATAAERFWRFFSQGG